MKLAKLQQRTKSLGSLLPTPSDVHRTKRLRGSGLQARNRRLKQKNPICVDCTELGEQKARAQGYTITVDEWDHVKSLDEGGVDDESNLAGRCFKHHREKSERERVARDS